MAKTYGQLVKEARENHDPPMTAKCLAEKLKVRAPFITDIEKGRRLPALANQEKIKELLVDDKHPATMFDDFAAAANDDPRIVAKDIATALRMKPAMCELIRTVMNKSLSSSQIRELSAKIGGSHNATE